ncbi:MAG: Gfo/Idh/MocA family oxidoreductase [Acidobacteriota bacterium]
MKKPVSIVLVGIGGMGSVYLTELLHNRKEELFRLAGTVDPDPQRCPYLAELGDLKIPVFADLVEFYSRREADLAIVSSPIHFHSEQTCLALNRGSDVLCEKPAAATIQEVRAMQEAEKRSRRRVSIGYQWSSSPAIQNLKKDIRAGLFGRPRRLKCLYLWPRDSRYYLRNDWAGKKKDALGRWILDSPANNAMAHDLHNMFYILGEQTETSVVPLRVEAELYRAYGIENFDTAAVRCLTAAETEILFYVSHAISVDKGPVFLYEFEHGLIEGAGRNSDLRAHIAGEQKNYGPPDRRPLKKMWDAIRSVGGNKAPVCGLEAATSQTLCINGAQESMPLISRFPDEMISPQGEPGRESISVSGLAEVLIECFEKNLLPSELALSWSRKGRPVVLDAYTHFPAGREADAGS